MLFGTDKDMVALVHLARLLPLNEVDDGRAEVSSVLESVAYSILEAP